MEKQKILPTRLAVRAIIVNSEQKVMLIKRAEGTYEGGKWCLIGGKPDNGEALDTAMARELQEEVESKFSLAFFAKVENPDTSTGTKWITHYFVGMSDILPKEFDSREVSAVGFFSQEEIKTMDIAFDHKEIIFSFLKSN